MLKLVLIEEGEVCAHQAVICGPHGWPKHDLIHIPALALLLHSHLHKWSKVHIDVSQDTMHGGISAHNPEMMKASHCYAV